MRVLILSTSIGTGHVRAAQAIEAAFKSQYSDVLVRHEDSLSFANAAFRKVYQQTYIDLVANAPDLLGLAYEYADRDWDKLHYGMAFERLNIGKLAHVLKDFKPDAIVCTHSLPADMVSWLLCRKEILCHHAIVITDFDLHAVWLCHHYSRYYVAIDETKEHLVALGFERNRVVVSGIPIDPVFAQVKDQRQMRIKHNLAPELLTIFVSAGGLGMGPVEQILEQLQKLHEPANIVVACGANAALFAKVRSAASENQISQHFISAIGFTTEIDEYMVASDLIIGKPGGLTSSEALAKGLVSVIVRPIPGQEERNADHLVEEGVAIRCNNLPVLAYKIEELLHNQERLKTMRGKAVAFAQPNSAARIASDICHLIAAQQPAAVHPLDHVCERDWRDTFAL
jgi:processive 1,2-diacylglycerol beta-glucosyltransferase